MRSHLSQPGWKPLPRRKLPIHTDFIRHGNGLVGRVKAWSAAAGAAQQLADEFGEWVETGHLGRVEFCEWLRSTIAKR